MAVRDAGKAAHERVKHQPVEREEVKENVLNQMQKSEKKELLTGVICFVVGAAYLTASFFLGTYSGYGSQNIDSAFLPKVLGVMMVVLSVAQIATTLRKAKKNLAAHEPAEQDSAQPNGQDEVPLDEDFEEATAKGASTKSFVMIFAALIIYIALLNTLGFMIMTAFFLIASMFILTPKSKRNIPLMLFLSIGVAVGVYFLFVRGMQLVLPAGILG